MRGNNFQSSLLDNADASDGYKILTHYFSLRTTNKGRNKNLEINIARLKIRTSQKQTSWLFSSVAEEFHSRKPRKNPASGYGGQWTRGPNYAATHSHLWWPCFVQTPLTDQCTKGRKRSVFPERQTVTWMIQKQPTNLDRRRGSLAFEFSALSPCCLSSLYLVM